MKRFLIILSLALAAAACHQPEYVKPTAERQGITSLTAYFTFGPFVDQEMAKLNISDPEQSRFVIPVPYYYPENSFDETEIYMIKARINAELQPNCKIEPGLNILDLTEENEFTYTDASGNAVTRTWQSTNQYITGYRHMPEGVTVIGGKTGTTGDAGYCLVLLSQNSAGQNIISLVYRADARTNLYLLMGEILEAYSGS